TDKTYKLVKQKFHVNLVDNVAYLDALTQKYDAQANLQIAYNNYEIDKANYYYQAGIPLEEKIQ
ncbi:MAG: TolC family protein, partial [Campylobacterales bacterium]|nr:TolC family protein [Campylobacterales bacterium]